MVQHKTELVGISMSEKIKQFAREHIRWLSPAGYFLMGTVMSNTNLFGEISPFGVAFCAAAPNSGATAAAFGSVIGYAFISPGTGKMKYVAALLLVAAAKWLFSPDRKGVFAVSSRLKRGAAFSVIISFFSLTTAALAIILSSGGTVYDLLLNLSEVFFACGATYFFAKSAATLRAGLNGAPKSDISCVIISLAIIVMGFAGLTVSGLSIGRIVSVMCILICARYGGEAGGSIAGVTAGIAMGLSGGDITYVVAAYSFGGLISGVFGNGGRLAAAVSFIATNAVVAFLTQDIAGVYRSAFEVFVATVFFIAVPQGFVSRLRPLKAVSAHDDSYARGVLRDRLSEISLALTEIGDTTQKVSEGLERMDSQAPVDVTSKIAEKVCHRCAMKNTCWQFSHDDTLRAMSTANNVLKRCGTINRARAPRYFVQNCLKLDELLTEFNAQFQSHSARLGIQRKVARVRAVIADQFAGLAMLIDELADEICGIRVFDGQKARKIRDYFEKENVAVSRVQAYSDDNERFFISLAIPNHQVPKLRRTKATLDLYELLDIEFDLPQITAHEQYAAVVFAEKSVFSVDAHAYQIAGNGARLCGDAYEFIKSKAGKSHFILSDGMGSGGGAAVDSAMASGLISQLLAVGVTHDTALKTVNAALIVKSGEESLATLDITTIDLYTGRADFYKAGAAPTYIIKNKRAGYVESNSLPAGILREVAFEHSVMSLREGDIIVMVSDGVTATGAEWVKLELEALRGKKLKHLCESLAENARSRREDKHEDDITVMAVELKRGG